MIYPSQAPPSRPPVKVIRASSTGFSAPEAFSSAFDASVRLLFRPFDGRRWLKLSVVCLFLGGGAPTAAFNSVLSSVSGDLLAREALEQGRLYFAQHTWLIVLGIVLGLGFGLALLYLRAVFRFVLVDAIVNGRVLPGSAWNAVEPLGRSYFYWLVGALATIGSGLAAGAIGVFPYLRAAGAAAPHSLAYSLSLVALLAAVVLVGVFLALVITLTDDLVVPIMYVERQPLAAAWRSLWKMLRGGPGPFLVYILVRFLASIAVGAAVMAFLFPASLGLFSGATLAGSLLVLALGLAGLAWVWNPLTTVLTLAGFGLLFGLFLILLSVVGMPGQVLLQTFGMRFIASRVPSLELLWDMPIARGSER